MTLIAYIFPILPPAKDVFRQMSKKSRSRKPFDKERSKQPQKLFRSARQHRYQIY